MGIYQMLTDQLRQQDLALDEKDKHTSQMRMVGIHLR